MPKNHHIENIVKLASKARLTPLENAQKSSYRTYYKVGIKERLNPLENAQNSSYRYYCKDVIKSKANPFGHYPKFIISRIL